MCNIHITWKNPFRSNSNSSVQGYKGAKIHKRTHLFHAPEGNNSEKENLFASMKYTKHNARKHYKVLQE